MSLVIALLALAGVYALVTNRRSAEARTIAQAIENTNRGMAAVARDMGIPSTLVPPPPPLPGQAVMVGPVGGPPGLLLRREPEIRGLPTDALQDYVRTTSAWINAGNVPSDAWWTSLNQARAEVFLRSRRDASTTDLTDVQLNALLSWLLRLQQAGMTLDSDELGLLAALRSELAWREQGGSHAEASANPQWMETTPTLAQYQALPVPRDSGL